MFKLNFRHHTPKNGHFLEKPKFTFLWKYSVCGFKIEISGYPKKLPYLTYSPYKYELYRTKTHEIRAKYFSTFFPLTVVCVVSVWWSCLRDTFFKKGDEEKNHRTKVASNPSKFQHASRNVCLYRSFISELSFTTYFLKYWCWKNDLARFSYRISVTKTYTP